MDTKTRTDEQEATYQMMVEIGAEQASGMRPDALDRTLANLRAALDTCDPDKPAYHGIQGWLDGATRNETGR